MGIPDIINKASAYTNPLLRDFTTSAENRLIKISNEVDDSDDWWNRNINDPLSRWLDKKGWLHLLKKGDSYQEGVVNCYNYNFEVIKRIFAGARSLDSNFGAQISSYNGQAAAGVLLLHELAECLDPSVSKHEVTVEERIFWFNSGWVQKKNGKQIKVCDLSDELVTRNRQHKKHKYSQSEIESFCRKDSSKEVFSDYSDYIYINELDYGTLEATGMVVFMGVTITKDELLSIMTREGYVEKQARENLSDIINSVIETKTPLATFIKDHDTAKELLLDYIKSKEKSDKKAFEEKHPDYDYSLFEKFVQLMGGIDVIKKFVEVYPEMLDYIFTDYKNGLEVLNSIESLNGASLSPEMQHAITHMRRDYENKFKGILSRLWDETVEFGFDKGTGELRKWIEDKYPPFKILKSILEISGGQEKYEGYAKLLSLQTIEIDTRRAFERAVEKVRTGFYTKDKDNVQPDQYTDDDLKAVENLFEVLKETNITIYKTYRDMCIDDPLKQVYANEKLERLNRITLNNYMVWPR